MAGKINIAEFEIKGFKEIIENTTQLKENIDILKESQKALIKEGKGASEQFVKNAADLKTTNAQYNANIKVMSEATKKIADQEARTKLLSVALNLEVKSIAQARASNKLLNKLRNETNVSTKKGKEELLKLNKALDSNNKFIKENSDQYAKQKINVGNYSESIKGALGQNTLFGKVQRTVNQILSLGTPIVKFFNREIQLISASYKAATASSIGYTNAQKAVAFSTNIVSAALRVLKVALIATGIGAILVLLGSLIAYFTRTQKGIDFINKALAGLSAAFDVITDRFSKLGGIVMGLVSGQKSLTEAWNEGKEALSGIGDEMQREIGLAIELERATQRLRSKVIALVGTEAERRKQIEDLRFAAKDELKTFAERAKALKAAGDLEKDILADKIEIAKEEARIAQGNLDLADSTDAQILENAEKQAAVINLQTESLKKQRTIEAERQGLLKRGRAQAATFAKQSRDEKKKAIDQAIKDNETRLKLFIEENKGLAKTLDDRVSLLKQVRDSELFIQKEKLEAGKINQVEYELAILKTKSKFLDDEKEATIKFANEELEIFKFQHQSRLEAGQLLNDNLVEQEIGRLDKIAEKEREFQLTQLEEGKISRLEYNQAIQDIDNQFTQSKSELEEQLKVEKSAREALDFENRQTLRIERDGLEYEAKLLELDRREKAEIAAAIKIGANTKLIEEKFADLRVKVKDAELDAKLSASQDLFGNIAELLGQETKAGKAAAIAQSTINTFQGVTEVWRTPSALLEPFATINRVVQTGVVLSSGLAAVDKIRSTNVNVPQAEEGMRIGDGGLLQGKRHSQGGIPIEAEGGEWVINRRASQMFNPLLALMNDYGKGNTGMNHTGIFADGGITARSITRRGGVTLEQVRQLILDNQQTIRVVNDPNETLDVFNEGQIIVENASI